MAVKMTNVFKICFLEVSGNVLVSLKKDPLKI